VGAPPTASTILHSSSFGWLRQLRSIRARSAHRSL